MDSGLEVLPTSGALARVDIAMNGENSSGRNICSETGHMGFQEFTGLSASLVRIEHPDKVMALQKRANELAKAMTKSPLLQQESGAVMKRIHAPPAFPGEEFEFNTEE